MHVVYTIVQMIPLIRVAAIVCGTAPIHTLRPILFRLVQGGVLARLHTSLLKVLKESTAEDLQEFAVPRLFLDSSTPPYTAFREGIVRHLFGSNALLRLRLTLVITDFCWVRSFPLSFVLCFCLGSSNFRIRPDPSQKSASGPENQSEYGTVAQYLLSAISHRVLAILVQHIDRVSHFLTRKLPPT